MIIVVEGISAAGKSAYSQQFGVAHWLPELPTKHVRPHDDASADEHAHFWAEHNVMRFQRALEIEREHGFVICDTDPLKIHYSWCMGQAGFEWLDKFESAMPFVRKAISDGRLGFANRYLVKRIKPHVARAQKEADTTRRRGNFDQHLALQPYLMAWFAAMDEVLPGRVEFQLPQYETLLADLKSKTPEEDPRRFDVSVFDALVERLPS